MKSLNNLREDNSVAEFLNYELTSAKSQPLKRGAVRVPGRAAAIYAGCFIVVFTLAYK